MKKWDQFLEIARSNFIAQNLYTFKFKKNNDIDYNAQKQIDNPSLEVYTFIYNI